jgi:exopolysaccharide biosynthesis polyprenyl glycosylphosphotransferase
MSRGRFISLSVLFDAVLINIAFVGAFYVRFGGVLPAFNFDAYIALAPILTLIYLSTGYIYGLYEPERTESTWSVARAVFSAVTLGAILTAAVSFMGGPRFFSFSRLAILMSWFLHNAALVGWRLLFMRLVSIEWPEQRVLVVGVGDVSIELAAELKRRSRWGYRVVGLLAGTEQEHVGESPPVDGLSVLGGPADAARVVAENRVDRVIIVSPIELRALVEDLALAQESDVRVDVVPELYEIFIGTVDSRISDIPLMEVTRSSVPPYMTSVKRSIDLVGALLILVLLSPVLVLAWVGTVATMGFPVFFRQERVGKELKPFEVFKLRTMVRDAEKKTGPVLASEDDPRVTPWGRFMRTYRIDELPQLFNILKGNMSFVGPRPERKFFVDQNMIDIPGYRERFNVKPGVTGLAQVSGGYATTPERKLKYDLIYMYHQNLAMDAQIVLETLRVVLTGRGAR